MAESTAVTSPGEPAPASCGRCGTTIGSETNFCPKCGTDLRGQTATSDTFRGILPGTVIDNRYRLLNKLGDGGMGVVFRVEHVRMGKVMALKMLRSEIANQPQVLERFRTEAQVVSKLNHPNTISVFDFGELEDGGLYIAMEYVRGRDLQAMLMAEGTLAEVRAATLCTQVLRSLEEAHEAGIVHRDIKPANVMVVQTRGGEDWAKVVDFGIAKLNEGGKGNSKITGVAEFVGTPNYCAPEQARGETPDPRTDLYAVGAMLFELVTGKPPYESPSAMGVIAKHLADPVPHARERNPELSEALYAVLQKALAKNPADRFQTAAEMRKPLELVAGSPARTYSGQELPIIDGYEISSREDWDQFERALVRSIRLRTVGGVALVLALLGAGAYAGYHKLTAQAPELPVEEEVEVNDEPAQANLIALDKSVRGSIGVSHKQGKSDLDTYRIELPNDGRLWVTLTGVRDLNLVLELFDAEKEANHIVDPLAHVTIDDGRLSEGELLSDVPVHAGKYFLRVSERPAYDEPDPTRPPRERESAPYTLTAHLVPPTELDEREPNDLWSLAQPVAPAQPVLGHAGYALPPHAVEQNLVLSTLDYFSVKSTSAIALLVQPPDRALGLWDAQKLQSWRAEVKAIGERRAELEKKAATEREAEKELKKLAAPFLSAPVRASNAGVAALKLESSEGLAGVLVAPLSGASPTANDAPYGLAFAVPGPGGLDGVLTLARELASRSRPAQAHALLEAALRELPNSEDAPKLKAALAQIK